MEQQKAKQPVNRIDRDLTIWEGMEQKLAKRYGAGAINDRTGAKVRLGIYKQILDKYRGKPLNQHEKIEYRMLRAQAGAINRKLYPNPWVRLARNMGLFAINMMALPLRIIGRLAKVVFGPFVLSEVTNSQRRTPSWQQDRASQQQNQEKRQQKNGVAQTNGYADSKKQGASSQNGNAAIAREKNFEPMKVVKKVNPNKEKVVQTTQQTGLHI
ncbi:hypothetical protein PV783_13775 [Chitinophaga sp. CC14]|uniref:hypothetical protein n=1 Tax=Chitinophaga sp. CC14 TaxID=3029199 RepID=UPI003B7D24BB